MARAPVVPLVVVWLSLIFALCLQVMPLADGWQVFRLSGHTTKHVRQLDDRAAG